MSDTSNDLCTCGHVRNVHHGEKCVGGDTATSCGCRLFWPSDTSNAPSTASELAEHIEFVQPADLAAYYGTEQYHRCRKDQEPWPCLAVRLAAQLQEADAQLLALRHTLSEVAWDHHHDYDHPDAQASCPEPTCQAAMRALAQPEATAQEAKARIEAPWREALLRWHGAVPTGEFQHEACLACDLLEKP